MSATQLPGYTSLSTPKESPDYPGDQEIPAKTWTDVDLGPLPCFDGPNCINAQLYFASVYSAGYSKVAVRIKRGPEDYTGQHDYTVKGPMWAISYHDTDYCKAPNLTRIVQVWSERACVLQSRIAKVTRPLLIDGSTT